MFRKTLESALRFGTTLLVKDVENYDPILNPVLNREVRNTAGRVLITIGDQDIDLSPAFKIILITRDSSVSSLIKTSHFILNLRFNSHLTLLLESLLSISQLHAEVWNYNV